MSTTIVYGTKAFAKFRGYYGSAKECSQCGKVYKQAVVRVRSWFHLEYIPLFPVKTMYLVQCPICGNDASYKKSQVWDEVGTKTPDAVQKLEYKGVRVSSRITKGFLKDDRSYELWVKDLSNGEEYCANTDLTKGELKNERKNRGIKKLKIETI